MKTERWEERVVMSRTKYPIHPDFKKYENLNPPLSRVVLPLMQKMMGPLFSMEKSTEQITVRHLSISASLNQAISANPTISANQTIRALMYTPVGISEPAPCLVYFHGGGFAISASPHHFQMARTYALNAKCKVLFVDYRLAPKHPFPAAPEDCYAAYTWLLEHAGEYSVDTSRIAVGGDSAGGQLATVVCLMARDRGQRVPCGQMMIYPVTGRNMVTESMKMFTDTPLCNSRDIEKYFSFYIEDPINEKSVYASPIHAESLEGLPPAYIETAEFDCLRDEGILYADRLREVGISVTLNNTLGTIHGFDIARESAIVKGCVTQRVSFLLELFIK
jgi:acetyl esterase